MSKVLFVSYAFPPFISPETIQAARCAVHMKKHGWEPSVLTAGKKKNKFLHDKNLLDLLSEDVKVTRSFSLEPGLFLTKSIFHLFPWILNLPDSRRGWCHFGYKKARQMMKKEQYDLLYSRACFFSSYITALKIKKQTGLPWVAHFSDPWTDNPYKNYGVIDGFINRRQEEAVIENADALVFVTEETRQLVMRKYPSSCMAKAHVIPNCFDKKLFPSRKKEKNERMTFAYTGNFYRGVRTPLSLFQALQQLLKSDPELRSKIRVQIVGELDSAYMQNIRDLQIEDVVEVIGRVSYMKSVEYMVNSDALLLIDAPAEEGIFLPSKLVEYIGSKRPVIGLTPEKGVSAGIIRKAGGMVVSPQDIKGIAKCIREYYDMYVSGTLENVFTYHEDLEQYDAEVAVKKLADLFNNTMKEKKG